MTTPYSSEDADFPATPADTREPVLDERSVEHDDEDRDAAGTGARAAAAAEWARRWRSEMDSNILPGEIADAQVSRDWAWQFQPADGERAHPSSAYFWSAADSRLDTDDWVAWVENDPSDDDHLSVGPFPATFEHVEGEPARREQLARWHDDDKAAEQADGGRER